MQLSAKVIHDTVARRNGSFEGMQSHLWVIL